MQVTWQRKRVAIVFAKANRTRIARELSCVHTYPGESQPVSIFMAGSPGAGKTEVSKVLIAGLDEPRRFGSKRTYRLQIRIDVIVKNTDGTNRIVELDADAGKIDALVTIRYSQDKLNQILAEA